MQKLLWLLLFIFVSCSTVAPNAKRSIASEQGWGFLVFSDIHVYTTTNDGKKKIVPKSFENLLEKLLPYVEENNIKFIVLIGDSTSGNLNDGHSLERVNLWWSELHEAFRPLMDKGVKILPVAGNHDYYTENQRQGYKKAWHNFVEPMDSEIQFDTSNPLYYTLNYGSMELFLLHSVDYKLGADQEAWMTKVMHERKDSGQLKIAMGHVAGYTRLTKGGSAFYGDHLRKMLQAGNVNHYIAGHEHYFWDETFDNNKWRQTIMGTSSGTYNYSPQAIYAKSSCKKNVCEVGPDKIRFAYTGEDFKQVHRQMFLHLEVDESSKSYKVKPQAFDGEIVPFNLP